MFQSKSGMIEPTAEKLYRMKSNSIMPKYLRMDNAGENKKPEKRCESKDWRLGLAYVCTARDTPQQNSPVEVGFRVIGNRARAMCTDANVPEYVRHLVFPKAAETATKLDGLVPVRLEGTLKTRYEHILGENPPYVDHLKRRSSKKAGEGTNNEDTLVDSNEIGVEEEFQGEENLEEGNEEPEGEEPGDTGEVEGAVPKTRQTRSGRTVKGPNRLIETMEVGGATADYKIGLKATEERYYDAMERFPEAFGEVACVGAGIGGGFTNAHELHVLTYNEAMATGDKEEWQDAVEEEYQKGR
ncbi:unknown protein [Seminavis robusta]|uniref:Uncharacterized protein n=1 Tax=Seminavis robusta TaxID=568900 RepID=A0A9N8ECC9_9STRA|nr:unknown protein [Seminavis robusta]|eukprot:Sro882_g215390.1 n/a (299) ;mRNA; r:38601-39678